MLKRRIISLVAAVSIATFAFSGCTEKTATNNNEKKELTYWVQLNANVSANYSNMGDTPMAKNIEKLTGIKVKYLHPAQGQVAEQFNLLLASDELPDMMEYGWYGFAGGPQKAISDGYIIELGDIIDKSAPNLKEYLKKNPNVDKMVKTDEGSYYVFPMIMNEDVPITSYGPVIRKDWLDELGLAIPETIDEWETVLRAFKEKKGARAPFAAITGNDNFRGHLLNTGLFVGAFGILGDFYLENGEVVYGPSRPEYKEFLKTFAKWQKEGLLDPDFATTTGQNLDTYVLTDKTGAAGVWGGSGLGKWIAEGKKINEKFDLVPTPYPVLNKGEKPKFSQGDLQYVTNYSVAITTSCKNPELAAEFLDFGYSEEGRLAYNFGIEGESYDMVEGQPKYTDLILNNPEGLSTGAAMGGYIRANYGGPFVQLASYLEQYYQLPQQKEALKTWSSEKTKYALPRISFTADESRELAKMVQNIQKHMLEYTLQVIMGKASVDEFDTYVNQLEKYGLNDVLEIYNNALGRYEKR